MSRSATLRPQHFTTLRATVADWICLALFAWFASYIDQYIYSIGGPPPLYSQVTALGLLVAITSSSAIGGTAPVSARITRLLLVVAVYVAWTLAAYLYSSQSEIANELLRNRLKVAAFIPLAALALDRPSMARPLAVLCAALAVFAAGLNVFDFISPTFSIVPGRAAGFYENPNTSGFMLVCLGVIGTRALSLPLRYAMWTIIVLAVFLTFSRAAWVYMFIAIAYLATFGELGFGRARVLFLGSIAVGIALISTLLLSGALYQFVVDTPIARFLGPDTIARIGASGSLFADYSSTERQDVLALGLQRFGESPLFGHGLASTHDWEARASTHNMYVLMLAEGGMVGLAVYLLLLTVLLYRSSRFSRLLAILVGLAGFASHNLLDMFGEGAIFAAIGASLRFPRVPRSGRHP